MSKDRFRIPITMDVPPEVSVRVNQRVAEDTAYVVMRENAIKKTYNNSKIITNLRKVGEYLLNHWTDGEMKVRDIARSLGIGEGSIKLLIADLNFWKEYPLKMIPVRGKPGVIQNSLKDINTTEKYLKQKSRTIASMEQVYDNVDSQIKVKRDSTPQKKKQVVAQKEEAETEENEGED